MRSGVPNKLNELMFNPILNRLHGNKLLKTRNCNKNHEIK